MSILAKRGTKTDRFIRRLPTWIGFYEPVRMGQDVDSYGRFHLFQFPRVRKFVCRIYTWVNSKLTATGRGRD